MTTRRETHRVGDLRPSQVLHTFGVGAVVDLPSLSVMVMGLDDWITGAEHAIGEERLLFAVQQVLGMQVKQLRVPPFGRDGGDPFGEENSVGVPVATFPRWLLCPFCRLLAPIEDGLFQLKTDRYRPDRARYVHANCSRGSATTALPARFLVACERGHLDDFPWHYFVHGGQPCPKPGALRLREYGLAGEASDIVVRCDGCEANRRMSDAFGDEGKQLMPRCRGRHPHLRSFDDQPCREQMRAILLGASNSWFGLTLSALSVPVAVDRLGQLVEAQWVTLEPVANAQNVGLLRQVGMLPQFKAYNDEQVWNAIERKRAGQAISDEPSGLKTPEWQVFINPDNAPALKDFRVSKVDPPPAYVDVIEQVVLVERLREVRALIGFTRITSPGDLVESTEVPEEYRVQLARRAPTWVPASEVHGEGIFIQFKEQALVDWLERSPAMAAYDDAFRQSHRQWRQTRHLDPTVGYPGLRYVLLHSFAHALMRQLSLECGYSLASVRERIYALPPTDDDGPMAGVLIYTAAPDSEGTLGGLVSLGTSTELGRHIGAALEQSRLCASDPLCAEHDPRLDPRALHGAACHACLFVPETSCERGNKYLDRTLLVPTLEQAAYAFFAAQ
jgi:hypothetical protein